jgi:lipopolysaccharide/colanic/teichoic acid biosynthesis glycosyltransferase
VYQQSIKRLADLIFSVLAFVILLPFFLVVLLLLLVSNNGHPFFVQPRPGRNEKIFMVIKFRTMTNERDGNGKLLSDAQRLTKIGRFIRSTSLDELPQLLNVFRGDMSLVGPRPLLVKYLDRYTPRQARRHEVRPGITGWAQVNGRNTITWEQKFEYDVYYVENISFGLDMKILLMTILKVIRREGISSGNSVSMEEFSGTAKD